MSNQSQKMNLIKQEELEDTPTFTQKPSKRPQTFGLQKSPREMTNGTNVAGTNKANNKRPNVTGSNGTKDYGTKRWKGNGTSNNNFGTSSTTQETRPTRPIIYAKKKFQNNYELKSSSSSSSASSSPSSSPTDSQIRLAASDKEIVLLQTFLPSSAIGDGTYQLSIKKPHKYSSMRKYDVDFMKVLNLYPREPVIYRQEVKRPETVVIIKDGKKEKITKWFVDTVYGLSNNFGDHIENIVSYFTADNSKAEQGICRLSKDETQSNMFWNWKEWAHGRFERGSVETNVNKYTMDSIEHGLFIAAVRVVWFLTKGLDCAEFFASEEMFHTIAVILFEHFPFIRREYTKLVDVMRANYKDKIKKKKSEDGDDNGDDYPEDGDHEDGDDDMIHDEEEDEGMKAASKSKRVKISSKGTPLSHSIWSRLASKICNRYRTYRRKMLMAEENPKPKPEKRYVEMKKADENKRNRNDDGVGIYEGVQDPIPIDLSPPEGLKENIKGREVRLETFVNSGCEGGSVGDERLDTNAIDNDSRNAHQDELSDEHQSEAQMSTQELLLKMLQDHRNIVQQQQQQQLERQQKFEENMIKMLARIDKK